VAAAAKKPEAPKKADRRKVSRRRRVGPCGGGLGNPGPEYRDTRHNIGQRVVEHLARQLKKAWHPDGRALVARGLVAWRHPLPRQAQSFMNVSGPSVRHVLHALGAGPRTWCSSTTTSTWRSQGPHAPAGQRGRPQRVQSVIDALGTEAIRRVKIASAGRRRSRRCRPRAHDLRAGEDATVATAVATAAERVLGLLR